MYENMATYATVVWETLDSSSLRFQWLTGLSHGWVLHPGISTKLAAKFQAFETHKFYSVISWGDSRRYTPANDTSTKSG